MLKLGKLPDRTPTRITIAVSAALNQNLRDYATLYETAYSEETSVAELIPFMLETFLKSDAAFTKARKKGLREAAAAEPDTTPRGAATKKPARVLSDTDPATKPKEA